MQINIRGQRVEIGEVEHHISQRAHGVQAVIVLLKHNFDNEKLVAAFSLGEDAATYDSLTVEQGGDAIDKQAAMLIASDLQHYLAQHVPDYMIPRTWVPLAKLPVNISGKADRRAVSEWIHSLSDDEIASFSDFEQAQDEEDVPGTTTERQIRQVWSNVLNVPVARIKFRQSFLSYGGDSITAMQVVSACRRFGISLSVRQVLQSGGISVLALEAGSASSAEFADIPDEPFDLSPAQLMYFKEIGGLRSDGDYRYNQSVCLVLQEPTPREKIADAIEALVAKHAMLRARFHHDEAKGWQQRVEEQIAESYHFDTHVVKDDEAAEAILQQSQVSLNIEDGPLFSADLIEIEHPERQILFLTAHHLVIDLMSWRIVVQDLEQFLLHGTAHPSHSMPFPAWCSALADEVHQHDDDACSAVSADASSWTYWGIEPAQYTASEQVFATAEIDQQTTDLLLAPAVHTAVRSTPVDILLAALMLSFQNTFTDRASPEVFIERHGRNSPMNHDLSDTVGWFTTITPLGVGYQAGDLDIVSAVKLVKELRRARSDHQISDFAKQYLSMGDGSSGRSHSAREIMFNYHGHFQQLERDDGLLRLDKLHAKLQDPQSAVASVGGSVKLQAALNVEVSVEAGRMQIRLGFSKNSPKGDAIRQWAQDYSRKAAEVVQALLRASPMATPSDFPLARFNSDEDLATVMEQFLVPAGIKSWEDVQDMLPCSPIQQGILLSQMKSPSTYWLKETCRVLPTSSSQGVDIDRLANAWRAVVQQHSIMRTIFAATPLHQDRLYQVVLASPEANIQHITCADSDVQRFLDQHSLRDYQPGQPLHRFLIVTTAGGDVYGQFEISHALVDASSVQLLVDALLKAYEAPEAAAIQRSDYSTYVSYLERRSEEEDLQYWQNLLGSAQPCNLQSDQNLGALTASSDDAAVETLPLSVSESIQDTSALYDFCQANNVTLANVVQLAWALVLSSRVDSRDQISFGYLSSGRDVPIDGVDMLIGPMINMMICHFDVDSMSGLTSSEAVRAVQDRFLEGFDHQRVSLASLQHTLQQSRLFNTTISYRRAQGAGHSKNAGSLQLERIRVDEPTEYDFSINVLASDTGIDLSLQYWSALASPGAAQSLMAQLRHVVTLICTSTAARLGDLELLSPEDQLIITSKNETAPAAAQNLIHSMTQQVAMRQPDAVAINAWDGTMTYGEVENAASRLAHHLVTAFEIGPEVKVGICMDKSIWAAVAMLATLKAGAVVLPLSTQQPLNRLQLVLNDTQAPIILVDSKQLSRLSSLGPRLVRMDRELVDGLPAPTKTIVAEVRPDNAAWIVYTSGSTGIPKGVVLQHHALCTSLLAHGTAFGLEASHRVLQFASHTFDVTIQEVFTTFFFGGCVCIPSEEDRLDNLEHAVVSLGVNFLSLTSTVAGLLQPDNLPAVREVILLGEPVNPLVLEKWLKHGATVLGAYGPSECSIQVTTSKHPFAHRKQAPVLGVPLASNFWVVDPNDPDYERLSPIGAPGELLIEGPLLAREYLNDPVKTANSFIVDPAFLKRYNVGGTGRRMYRTGDLVRQNHDGTYTILGRRDTQIKIRGQRVEIGEVEYHIGRHSSGIHAAVVLLQGSSPDDTKLVAGFSLQNDAGYNSTTVEEARDVDKPAAMLVASEVQHYLSQHIPVYMIPHLWVPLKKLPVNPNGKIDRLTLSKYINSLSTEELASYSDAQSSNPQGDYDHEQVPATPVERQIREIWTKVLNVGNITYRRSFLSYGGDSITAMQVVSACRQVGLTLSVRDVLQSHAISELALVARNLKTSNILDGQLATSEIPDGPFDLSPAQRMYFKDIALNGLRSDGEYRFNQSVVFQLQEPIQQQTKVARAIEVLVAEHPMLRARFQVKPDGEKGWQQRINKNLVGSYHFQTHVAEDDEAARAVIRSSQASLDIEHGPIFAADFIELPDRQLLFLTAHHLVIDLMSWRIIAQDLEHLLRDGTTTSASGSLSFPSWCAVLLHQAQRLDGLEKAQIAPDTLATEAQVPSWDYWGIERGQYLWADQTFAVGQVDNETTRLLLGPANQALRTSPADILLAALDLSFRKVFTDRSGPSISIEGHGRGGDSMDYDLSETVGWLTTITRLRLAQDDNQDGAGAVPLVKQVKDVRKLDTDQQALEFASQYLLEGAANASPVEVLFNFHGQFQQLERQGGLLRLDRLHQPGGQSDISSTGGSVKMQAALNVEVWVEDGQAQISIGFSKHSPKHDAIRKWCSEFSRVIAATVAELNSTTPTATASDFQLAHLTNPDLAMVEQRCLAPVGVAWEDVEDVLPCSPVQQGILLSQLKAPSSYLLKQTCRILPGSNTTAGQIDTSRLAIAWNHVIQQHSIMRTIFTRALLHQDRFYQIVLKPAEVDVRTVECATDADVQECVERHMATIGTQPSRPQHQFMIITTSKDGHVYGHFEISHALVDASSVQILVESMMQAYEGVTAIPTSSYSSYVSFLEHSNSEEEDLAYWKDLLATAEPCNLQLNQAPFEEVVEAVVDAEPVTTVVLEDLSELQTFCRTHSVTPANVFQLAWSVVLGSRIDSPQISFGCLSSGRDVPIAGVDTLVGPMINMMICHLELDYNMTPSKAIQQVQSQLLEGFNHQRAPLAAIKHSLHASQQNLFNTTLSYRRIAAASTGGAQSIQLKQVDAAESTDYDFNLSVNAADSSIELVLQFLPAVANKGAAHRLLCQLKHVVEALCSSANANLPLGDLELIPQEDRGQISSTNAQVPSAVETCIHSLFQEMAASQPAAEAIYAWDGTMTYQTLDETANRLAYRLSGLGIGPEIMVGMCMDKSLWAAVSILGKSSNPQH